MEGQFQYTKKEIRRTYNAQVLAEFISTLGDTLFFPTLISLAVGFKNSALLLALVTISEYTSYILSPFLGNFVDRLKSKTLMIYITCYLQAALYLLVTLILICFSMSKSILLILIFFNLISGILNKIDNNLQLVLVLNLIEDEEDIQKYRGNNMLAKIIVQVIGQFVGANLLLVLSISDLALLNAFTFLLPLLILRPSFPKLRVSNDKLTEKSQTSELSARHILREVFHSSSLMTLLIFVGLANFVAIPLASLFVPELLKVLNHVKTSDVTLFYSIVVMIYGFGIIGGVGLSNVFKQLKKLLFQMLISSLLLNAVLLMILYSVHYYWILLVFAFLFGVLSGLFNVNAEGYFYSVIPNEQAASYNGIMQAITMGAGLIGTMIATGLIQQINIRATLFTYGAILLVFVLFMIIYLKARSQKTPK